ncbi:hypothetical protein [Bosea sp. PAMC 26642]|uniref:hypothetical protein n=1 Tax=Bosea sp. (strain PAMC 26642) TaxID=1792307 RepID=UPI0007702AA2|nr:hypothetical protein [Bosea sp. PAMC 26642]AMJ62699.1 hypothetical protein AXW83_22510 [Bosea sp. PAMC 26642]
MIDIARLQRLAAALWQASRRPNVHGVVLVKRLLSRGRAAETASKHLVDARWYEKRYPGSLGPGETAWQNYLADGAAKGRDPGPLFDTQWYLLRNPDVATAGINPLLHYLEHGMHEFRDPSPLFDSVWYFSTYPQAKLSGLDACSHYMLHGAVLGYDPGPYFSTKWYLETYPEIAALGENPLLHYLLRGADQGLNPNNAFNTVAYVECNPGYGDSGKNPLVFFLLDEERRRQAWMRNEGPTAVPLGRETMAEIHALIERLGDIEPDLLTLQSEIEALPVPMTIYDETSEAWRGLYLSLFSIPRSIVFVGSLDDTPELADLVANADDLLIVETDMATIPGAEHLPRGAEWRALSEFSSSPNLERNVAIATALVNNLQPRAVLVWGSRAGWEMIARHGAALRHNTRLFATSASMPDGESIDTLHYLSAHIPLLSALYAPDPHLVALIDKEAGLPPGERDKLRSYGDWAGPADFPMSGGHAS